MNIGFIDTLAYKDSPIHRLDPRAKLISTLLFIVLVVSFDEYEISGLIPFIIYPIFLIALGNLPLRYLLKKMLLVSPFAIMIGIFNPFFDQKIILTVGDVGISGGWVSFMSIMLRFVLTVSATLTLIACTGFNAVCLALSKMGVPKVFIMQLLFLYRYIYVLMEEGIRMIRAKSLRSFSDERTSMKVFVSMLGNLLLRTLDRAQRIYQAMTCRGFDGEIRLTKPLKIGLREVFFLFFWSSLFIVMKLYNLPHLLGLLVKEIFG